MKALLSNKMKLLGVILFISFHQIGCAQTTINWISVEKAQASVKKRPKNIFIYIYSDGCSYCDKMASTTLNNPEIVNHINQHYYAIKINAETTDTIIYKGKRYVNPNPEQGTRHQFARILAVMDKTIGFPTMVFFDRNFNKFLDRTRGYKSVEKLGMYLKFIDEGHYNQMTFEEFISDDQSHAHSGL